jgi:hypothetical protein
MFDWRRVASKLRLMFEGKGYVLVERHEKYSRVRKVDWPHPAAQRVGKIGIYLVPSKDGRQLLSLQPDSLADALTLYGARMLATGTTFQTCEHCHTPFLSGGSLGGTKRGDARFCDDKCRSGYHNEARRKRKTKL